MTKRPNLTVQPINIYRHAERFRLAGEYLRREKDPAKLATIGPPAIVLAAFSAELFLKCLLMLETGKPPPRGHNLKALFRDLTPASRRRIEDTWNAHLPSKEAVFRAAEAAFGVIAPRKLVDALDEGARGFEQMRYVYENDRFNFTLEDLPGMVRAIVLDLTPEWRDLEPRILPLAGAK